MRSFQQRASPWHTRRVQVAAATGAGTDQATAAAAGRVVSCYQCAEARSFQDRAGFWHTRRTQAAAATGAGSDQAAAAGAGWILSRHNVIAEDERIGNNAEAVSSAVVAAATNGAACFD